MSASSPAWARSAHGMLFEQRLAATVAASATGFVPVYQVGDLFPGFTAMDSNGQSFDFSQVSGRYVLIDFCAQWCFPCVTMAPDAIRVQDAINSAGVPFTYVQGLIQNSSVGPTTQANAQQWMAQHGVVYPVRVLHVSGVTGSPMAQAFTNFAFNAFPSLVLLLPDGHILVKSVGALPAQDLVEMIAAQANVPTPPLPGVSTLPLSSQPANLQGATVTLRIGNDSASGSNIVSGDNMAVDLTEGSLPIQTPEGFINILWDRGNASESWLFGAGGRAIPGHPALPIPHDQPLTITFSNLVFNDGCQIMHSGTGVLHLYDLVTGELAVTNSRMPVDASASNVHFGPFMLQDVVANSTDDVAYVLVSIDNVITHSVGLQASPLPGPIAVNSGGTATFTATVDGGEDPLQYQWQKDGVDLADGGGIAGSHSPSLTLNSVTNANNGYYGVRVTDSCRTVHTGYKRLSVIPLPCAADTNNSHTVNIDDLVLIIINWGATSGPADVNHDNIVNIDDLVLVITHWGNCP